MASEDWDAQVERVLAGVATLEDAGIRATMERIVAHLNTARGERDRQRARIANQTAALEKLQRKYDTMKGGLTKERDELRAQVAGAAGAPDATATLWRAIDRAKRAEARVAALEAALKELLTRADECDVRYGEHARGERPHDDHYCIGAYWRNQARNALIPKETNDGA